MRGEIDVLGEIRAFYFKLGLLVMKGIRRGGRCQLALLIYHIHASTIYT